MKILLFTITALAVFSAAKVATSQSEADFRRFDRNGDGIITAAEQISESDALERNFRRYDTNGDGIVTAEEAIALNEAPESVVRNDIVANDKDGDGGLNLQEYTAMRASYEE